MNILSYAQPAWAFNPACCIYIFKQYCPEIKKTNQTTFTIRSSDFIVCHKIHKSLSKKNIYNITLEKLELLLINSLSYLIFQAFETKLANTHTPTIKKIFQI